MSETVHALVPEAVTVRQTVDHRALAEAWATELGARAAAGLLAPRTADAYARHARRWVSWLAARAVSVPTPAHVVEYLSYLRAAGLSPATCNAYLDAVRGLYRWAETRNAYPAIARSVRGLPVRKDEPLDCLDRDAVAGLLDHCGGGVGGLRDAALVHVAFCSGLRLASLCALDVGDYDPRDATLTYRGKGDRAKDRRAYLSPGAVEAVERYLAARRDALGADLSDDAPLFVAISNRALGQRLTTRSMRRVIVGLMERAGHVRRDSRGRVLRPRVLSAHSLRRSAITAAYAAAGLDAAQILAGHADPKTTRRAYARVESSRLLRGLSVLLDLRRQPCERPRDAAATCCT